MFFFIISANIKLLNSSSDLTSMINEIQNLPIAYVD